MVPEFENSNFFSVVSFSETPVCLEVKEIFAAVKESPEKNLRLQWEALKASDFFFFFFLGFLRRSLSLVSLSAVHIRLISLICASLYCMLCCTCIISYVRLFAFFGWTLFFLLQVLLLVTHPLSFYKPLLFMNTNYFSYRIISIRPSCLLNNYVRAPSLATCIRSSLF